VSRVAPASRTPPRIFMTRHNLAADQHTFCSAENDMKSATPLVDDPPTVGNEHPPTGDSVEDELLTVNDAARLLHVSVSWVYEHTRDNAEDRLPSVKLGKYVRFDREDLRAYIDAKRHASKNHQRRR